MDEAPYSNRELDKAFDEIHEKLDLILAQTTKTNGRVSALELWKEGLMGKIAIITVVLGMAGSVLVALITKKIWNW